MLPRLINLLIKHQALVLMILSIVLFDGPPGGSH